ncbi:MAG: cell surface protein SprA, partial [Bacteroidia bacterium]
LPLKNYKWTDWINGTGTYTATFNWMNPPEAYPGLGATISNTRAIQTSGNLNMTQLYNKSKFLKKMLEVTPPPPPSKVPPKGGKLEGKDEAKGMDKEKKEEKGKKEPKKITINPDWPDKYKLHPPKEHKFLKALLKTVVRLVLSVRKIDVSYNQNDATTQPGYMPKTDNFGLDFGFFDQGGSNVSTPFAPPTLGFMLGDQKDIRGYATNYYWISRDTTLSNYFANTSSSQLTVRANVEPMPGFTIDLNATRNETNNFSELFRWDNQGSTSYYRFTDQQLNGTYSSSYIFIGSAFETMDKDKSKNSASFDRFSRYRQVISDRLASENPSTSTLDYQGKVENGLYSNGYTGTAQDVLIPALLAGYGIVNPSKIELSPFPKIPLPNWNVSFNPMTAFPSLKKNFQSISIKHSYRGTYTIGAFNRNLNAQDLDGDGFADNTVYLETDINGNSVENFNSVRNIQLVQMTEQMSPLIGVNATTKNGITLSASYGRGRQMTFNMGNLQLTDIRNQDLSFSAGWRKDKLNLKFRFAGKDINLDNTLEAKVQITMRDMIERNRTLDGLTSIPLRGQINWVINPYLDYTVSKRLSIKAFWQQNINDPHTSMTFKNSFRSVGVQLRFSLN